MAFPKAIKLRTGLIVTQRTASFHSHVFICSCSCSSLDSSPPYDIPAELSTQFVLATFSIALSHVAGDCPRHAAIGLHLIRGTQIGNDVLLTRSQCNEAGLCSTCQRRPGVTCNLHSRLSSNANSKGSSKRHGVSMSGIPCLIATF